jgi:phosphate uptake regulator
MSELRRVQRTPGGTFFVSLPKPWAEIQGLQKGTVLALSQTSDGKLLVDAKYDSEIPSRIALLHPGSFLGREIIGAYLLGFDIISVEDKAGIGFEVQSAVRNTINRLVGLEIVEEDHSTIVLQCLLEPSGFPPEKILRRGYAIAAGMHRDAVSAFVDGDVSLAKSVMARDDEGNRLYFLLVRILRTIIQNPSLSDSLGVSPIECLDYRLAASLVEAIGDECVRISLNVVESKGVKLNKELRRLFVTFNMICLEAHENALTAFLTRDVDLAEKVRTNRERMGDEFARIEEIAREQSPEVMPQILAVASFLRQIFEHSVDLSDLAVPKSP